MSKFKTVTHVLALLLAGAAAFMLSPAGKALEMQYPAVAAVGPVLAIATAYFNSKKE